MPETADAATFERFRAFADEAVTQLLQEMAEKRLTYPMAPDGDALTLVRTVATLQHTSPWQVWEGWALRHAIPVHYAIEMGAEAYPAMLRKRLRDLLGYCVLGLLLAEEG